MIAQPRDFGFWTHRLLRLIPGRSTIEPVRGLYLWGGVGRGKTMLMDRFFESLPFADRERRHFHRFMHEVHAELRRIKTRTDPLEILAHRLARRARVICFDELNVTDIADAMILGTLFDALFRRGVTLVATSNVAPAELYRDGLQRQRFLPAIALIERHTEVLHVEGGTDYRLRQLRKARTYRIANGADEQKWLEETFRALAGGPGSGAAVVTVEQRPIPCKSQSDGVIWFDFKSLCEGPRSQNDYIELSRCYHSVLLSEIPALGETADNAARRFIALVDELYDRNVNLIVSADAPAPELYKGQKLAFEFQRTISRLTEMQSEDYLAKEHKP